MTYVWRAQHGQWVAWRAGLWCFGATADAAAAELGRRYIDGARLVFFAGTKPGMGGRSSRRLADLGYTCEGFFSA